MPPVPRPNIGLLRIDYLNSLVSYIHCSLRMQEKTTDSIDNTDKIESIDAMRSCCSIFAMGNPLIPSLILALVISIGRSCLSVGLFLHFCVGWLPGENPRRDNNRSPR